ncbi:MAG TPA: peroxiredoxin [Candidatus Dependentiae bacterium]|nr:peroxiredoxin [Candidatus Dependentiae bacterium]HRQ62419.1 peroxiredoxin [Candidatus Dependentiae bacterium]
MLNKLMVYTLICTFVCICFVPCAWGKKIKIHDAAPDFSLLDSEGNVHTLSALRGKKVALYFYPKDSSPYCTKQACNLRDNFATLKKEGITILGISSGSTKSKQKFKTKYQLPFPLLQADKKTLRAYGVHGFLTKRKTFLIDGNGTIVDIITKVDVNNHTQQIINGFKKSS